MDMREFTKSDWSAFCGAEAWPDGAKPLVGGGLFENGTEYVLVLDSNGGCAVINAEDGDLDNYALDMPLLNQSEARVLAQRLDQPRHRIDFLLAGFKQV